MNFEEKIRDIVRQLGGHDEMAMMCFQEKFEEVMRTENSRPTGKKRVEVKVPSHIIHLSRKTSGKVNRKTRFCAIVRKEETWKSVFGEIEINKPYDAVCRALSENHFQVAITGFDAPYNIAVSWKV